MKIEFTTEPIFNDPGEKLILWGTSKELSDLCRQFSGGKSFSLDLPIHETDTNATVEFSLTAAHEERFVTKGKDFSLCFGPNAWANAVDRIRQLSDSLASCHNTIELGAVEREQFSFYIECPPI